MWVWIGQREEEETDKKTLQIDRSLHTQGTQMVINLGPSLNQTEDSVPITF